MQSDTTGLRWLADWLDAYGAALILAAIIGGPFVVEWRRRRRKARETHHRIENAVARIMEDGKVEGPKGRFRWLHFGKKWVDYSNALPGPRAARELPKTSNYPRYPHIGG